MMERNDPPTLGQHASPSLAAKRGMREGRRENWYDRMERKCWSTWALGVSSQCLYTHTQTHVCECVRVYTWCMNVCVCWGRGSL